MTVHKGRRWSTANAYLRPALKRGIEIIADRPGVGANLQDHLEVYFQIACRQPVSLYKYLNPLSKALIGLRWLLTKQGLGASNQFETLGFIRSDKGLESAEIHTASGQILGVQNCTLQLRRGEILVLMGLSGSGKSTLLRAVNRLNSIAKGQLTITTSQGNIELGSLTAA